MGIFLETVNSSAIRPAHEPALWIAFDALRVASVKIRNPGDDAVLIYKVVLSPSGVISRPIIISPAQTDDPDFTEERRVQIKKFILASEALRWQLNQSPRLKKLIYSPR